MESSKLPKIDEGDMLRLARLSEEIRSRLAETAMIVARVSGNPSYRGSPVARYMPRNGVQSKRVDQRSGDWMEIIDVDGQEACYGVIGGKPFAESPCGG